MTLRRTYFYKISNKDCDDIYVGSTAEKYYKKRLWRHRNDAPHFPHRYGKLFLTENYSLSILEECDLEHQCKERWEKERYWQDIFRATGCLINKNRCGLRECEKKTCIQLAQKKYKKTERGREIKKWQNYRYWMKKRLLAELKSKLPLKVD